MKRLTFILLASLVLTGCSNSLTNTLEPPKIPKFSMPELPKMPKLSLPSWAKPKLLSIGAYKPTIMQGSVLDINEVNQLQLGMSKEMVLNLIGSPSIVDSFNNNRWDYINHSSTDGEINVRYHLKLIFEDNILAVIDKTGLEELSIDN